MEKFQLKEIILNTGLFNDNEWLDNYCSLIKNNLSTKKEKNKTQSHHIIPQCYYKEVNLKVDNSNSNLVNLLYKDHILAHYYICLCCNNKHLKENLTHAFMHMCFQKIKYLEDFNPKDLSYYSELYENYIAHLRESKRTPEQCLNISKGKLKNSTKGKPNYKRRGQCFPHSEETKTKIKESLKNIKRDFSNMKSYIKPKFDWDEEEVIDYCVNQYHSMEECASHFNTTKCRFESYLKRNNITKAKLTGSPKFDKLLSEIDKDDFINYYKTHKAKEVLIHFNIDSNYLQMLKNHFHLKNKFLTFNELLETLNKEEIYNYYIVENHSSEETAHHFKIGVNLFPKILKYFNIKKVKTTKDFLNEISFEALYNYYIKENHSHKETQIHFNISPDILNNILAHYKLGKRKVNNANIQSN